MEGTTTAAAGPTPSRRRSWWGWGWEDQALDDATVRKLCSGVASAFGVDLTLVDPPTLADLDLPPPRVAPPESLASIIDRTPHARASHSLGKSYRDVVRGLRGQLDHPPDLVARPRREQDVSALLEWCTDRHIAAIPYGGGSSVVGGVEADVGDEFTGAVSIDMTGLDRVLEIDPVSRAARIQAGALGPVIEEQLRPSGHTLRHFPQSFEFSTLGGWLATRSGGHYATLYTHIEDLLESMRVVTPTGISESARLPGSGAGPSPDRFFCGSEGSLGIITEAWMRIQDRPRWKTSAGVHFADMASGAEGVRALSQSGLFPTNCRLLDPTEAMTGAGVGDGSALLVLGFESADHPLDGWMDRALEVVADHGGSVPGRVRSTGPDRTAPERPPDGAVDAWRESFLRAPYGRDALVRMSAIVETFETACTWDRFPDLHATVLDVGRRAIDDVCGPGGWITCRFTHVYPDGPAPYFSVVAPGRPGSEVVMWDELKIAFSEALASSGGTITHHHAVGRDHHPWYSRQRPEPMGRALRAAKDALDPAGILNPGVICRP